MMSFLRITGCTRSDLLNREKCHCLNGEAKRTLWSAGGCASFKLDLQRKNGARVPVLTGGALLKRDPSTLHAFVFGSI